MAITRDASGVLRVLEDVEPAHVALLHQLIRDSNNAGERGVDVRGLHRRIRAVVPETTHEQILQNLLALEKEGLLAEDRGSQRDFFLHTSTVGFRLEYASTAYRRAVSDIELEAEGQMFALLDYADDVMRAVKAAGKDPSHAGALLERLKKPTS